MVHSERSAIGERYNLQLLKPSSVAEVNRLLAAMDVVPRGREIMAPKGLFFVLRAEGLSRRAAVILKQEMLAKGGEAALPRQVYLGGEGAVTAILMGTKSQFAEVCETLAEQPFGLAALGREIETLLMRMETPPPAVKIGGREFVWGRRTYVMGILNATPDSFSGDGLYQAPDPVGAALAQAKAMVDAGADLLDLGAESTRPGAEAVSAEEELARLLPCLRAIAGELKIPISVDTWKARVAEAALANGASCINEIRGLRHDPELAGVVARAGAPVIVMHSQDTTDYGDLMSDIVHSLRQSMDLAEKAGVPIERVIIDPGLGGGSFGKTREQSLQILRDLGMLRCLGRPILVGASRKSFIRQTLDLPSSETIFGTAAIVALSIANGADIVRVHDVREMSQVARIADAIMRSGE